LWAPVEDKNCNSKRRRSRWPVRGEGRQHDVTLKRATHGYRRRDRGLFRASLSCQGICWSHGGGRAVPIAATTVCTDAFHDENHSQEELDIEEGMIWEADGLLTSPPSPKDPHQDCRGRPRSSRERPHKTLIGCCCRHGPLAARYDTDEVKGRRWISISTAFLTWKMSSTPFSMASPSLPTTRGPNRPLRRDVHSPRWRHRLHRRHRRCPRASPQRRYRAPFQYIPWEGRSGTSICPL
jgi:hypothetical protein